MTITHHVVYVDESQSDGGRAFALAAIFVRHDAWFDAHRAVVDLRRWLARKCGLHMDKEVKASELVSGSGPWFDLELKRPTRHGIYRSALELLAGLALAVRVLGVAVPDREDLALQRPFQEEAWRVLLLRVGRYCQEPPATCDLRVDNGAFPQLRS